MKTTFSVLLQREKRNSSVIRSGNGQRERFFLFGFKVEKVRFVCIHRREREKNDGAGRREGTCWSSVHGWARGAGIQCPEGGQFYCKEREGRAMATVIERWAGVVVGIMGMIF